MTLNATMKSNIIFMGTPDFALPTLKKLTESHKVNLVICQPDKSNRRGKKIEIGPKQIIKVLIYAFLIWWVLSTLKQLFVSDKVAQVPISQVIEAAKKNDVAKKLNELGM